jgi:hypothetical protein
MGGPYGRAVGACTIWKDGQHDVTGTEDIDTFLDDVEAS